MNFITKISTEFIHEINTQWHIFSTASSAEKAIILTHKIIQSINGLLALCARYTIHYLRARSFLYLLSFKNIPNWFFKPSKLIEIFSIGLFLGKAFGIYGVFRFQSRRKQSRCTVFEAGVKTNVNISWAENRQNKNSIFQPIIKTILHLKVAMSKCELTVEKILYFLNNFFNFDQNCIFETIGIDRLKKEPRCVQTNSVGR